MSEMPIVTSETFSTDKEALRRVFEIAKQRGATTFAVKPFDDGKDCSMTEKISSEAEC
jgi:hypothetical protein